MPFECQKNVEDPRVIAIRTQCLRDLLKKNPHGVYIPTKMSQQPVRQANTQTH